MVFKCPECKSDSFTIRGVVETHESVTVNKRGDVWDSSGGDMTWEDKSEMSCDDCGYEGLLKDFQKQSKKKSKK